MKVEGETGTNGMKKRRESVLVRGKVGGAISLFTVLKTLPFCLLGSVLNVLCSSASKCDYMKESSISRGKKQPSEDPRIAHGRQIPLQGGDL